MCAAKLELAAAGVSTPSHQMFRQHDAALSAAPLASLAAMSDDASRQDLNSYFDAFKSPASPKLAAVQPAAQPIVQPASQAAPVVAAAPSPHDALLEERLGEQDAVIKELKSEVAIRVRVFLTPLTCKVIMRKPRESGRIPMWHTLRNHIFDVSL